MTDHPDIRVSLHGTVALVVPLTEAGTAWLDEQVAAESWQYIGGALAAEPRYLDALIAGMRDDGLAVVT